MEKIGRAKSQDLGLAMLQTRKHAGKATCKSQRDHRMRKSLSPKGLREIEEIDKDEISNKMMETLERFMRAYPAVWSESSLQHLLVEIADTQYASSQDSKADERLQTIIMRILVPMAKIMEAEQGFMKVERQKIQEATLALQRVQGECYHALVELKQEHDRSARDLEELGKALEENRNAAVEAAVKLAEKENQIHDMLQQQRDLLVRLVCGGPTGFVEWAREEIQSQGLHDLDGELQHAWWPTSRVSGQVKDKMLISLVPECSSLPAKEQDDSAVQSINQFAYKDSDKSTMANLSANLLCLVLSEVIQQMEESYGRVKGPLSLPSAFAGFWLGLAGRMAYLAVVSMFPQVIQKPNEL